MSKSKRRIGSVFFGEQSIRTKLVEMSQVDLGWNPASNSEEGEGFVVREVQGRRGPLKGRLTLAWIRTLLGGSPPSGARLSSIGPPVSVYGFYKTTFLLGIHPRLGCAVDSAIVRGLKRAQWHFKVH